jgi:hypothetical protein
MQQVFAVGLSLEKIANLAFGGAPDGVAFDRAAALGGEIHSLTLLLAQNFLVIFKAEGPVWVAPGVSLMTKR